MNNDAPTAGLWADWRAAVSQLAGILFATQPLDEFMEKVTRLARDAVPGKNEASITLVADGRARTAAFTADVTIELDERQYNVGYGPCLDAADTGQTILVEDTATNARYPEFAGHAFSLGVYHSLSVGLPVPQGTVGALNVYRMHPAPFDGEAIEAAQTFASYAAVALANAALYADAAQLAEQMQRAMESRAVIEQAKGILMRDNRCGPDEAFEMLVTASNRSNRKLRDIAVAIVERTQRGT